MKEYLVLLVILFAFKVNGQPTNVFGGLGNADIEFELGPKPRAGLYPTIGELKPNEITAGKLVLSGIVVEAVKTGQPLQLLNPFAPPEYGSPEDNVVRAAIGGKVVGLKFFNIRF